MGYICETELSDAQIVELLQAGVITAWRVDHAGRQWYQRKQKLPDGTLDARKAPPIIGTPAGSVEIFAEDDATTFEDDGYGP